MPTNTIVILGGYGGTGKIICKRLLQETDVPILITGRDIQKAKNFCLELKKEFPSKHISATFADSSDYSSLVTSFKDAKLIIDATTATEYVENVAKAALETHADYLDFHFDQNVFLKLEALQKDIIKNGQCFITQAGFHPGLPSAFVRFAAPQFDEMKKAIIGMAMNEKIEKAESIYELVDTIQNYFKTKIYKKKKWRKVHLQDSYKIHFGSRFGTQNCYPLQLEEMFLLPQFFPSLEETGVYVAGFNWFIDYLVLPLAFILFGIKKNFGRHFIAKLFVFGFNHFSQDQTGVSFVLEAEGTKNNTPKKLKILAEHDNGYEFTAIPIVACVLQYLNGTIAKPGVSMMGHIVEPNQLMKDIQKMGINIKINE